jgi:hypothetical protein
MFIRISRPSKYLQKYSILPSGERPTPLKPVPLRVIAFTSLRSGLQ